jgi:type III secretion protein J
MNTPPPTLRHVRAASLWVWVACGMAALLVGCKTDLFTKRTEVEANEMVGVLMERRIDVSKHSQDGGKTWNVAVEEDQVPQALSVLRASGLPQDKYASLGEIFKKEGLISTPTDERVRFIHGMTQELSATLSKIDGVVVAKVHIVLPNNDPLAKNTKPSSASVFVKYRPDVDLPALTPAIKNLVSRSVEGLAYEHVTVTLVPGNALPVVVPHTTWLAAHWVELSVTLLALLVGLVFALARWRPLWLPQGLARLFPRPVASANAEVASAPQ